MRNSLVNRAGWASALSVAVLASFGIGIGTGMLAGRLWPEPPATPASILAAAKGEVEAGGGFAETVTGFAGDLADDLAERASELTAGAFLGHPEALALTTDLSARQKLEAIARPVRVAARGPTLQVAALATGGQARLEKAALPRLPAAVVAEIVVRPGDTLMDILQRAEVDRAGAYAAVESLRAVYDPRRLRVGQALRISTTAGSDDRTAPTLVGLELALDLDYEVRVERDADGGFVAAKVDRPQQRRLVQRGGEITDSLYLSAERAAVPQEVVVDLIRLFSWDVDFQRDIRHGDRFEALFEEVSLVDGDPTAQVRGGDVLYGRMSLGGRDLEGFRFEHGDGKVDYYDRTGQSLRKFLLRTPIDGARTTSRFGMRRHPILGYTRMHQGVDFAAATGTPIYAAGDGKVVVAGRNGGYGRYVKLRHTGEYDTAYAHMSRIADGIAPGRRVSQGQVIGYVGTTGRSTGPHLHYEVLRQGKQINPLSIKQPANVRLTGADLDRLRREIARIDRLRVELAPGPQLASRVD